MRSTSRPLSRKYSAAVQARRAARILRSGDSSPVATMTTERFMPSVHLAFGYTAKALMPSQESRFRPLPKQLQPPFLSRFVTSHSNALRTAGWSA